MSSRLDGRFPVIHSAFTLLLRQQSPVDHSRDATRDLIRIASLVIHSDIVLCQRQQSAVDLAGTGAPFMQQPRSIVRELMMNSVSTGPRTSGGTTWSWPPRTRSRPFGSASAICRPAAIIQSALLAPARTKAGTVTRLAWSAGVLPPRLCSLMTSKGSYRIVGAFASSAGSWLRWWVISGGIPIEAGNSVIASPRRSCANNAEICAASSCPAGRVRQPLGYAGAGRGGQNSSRARPSGSVKASPWP